MKKYIVRFLQQIEVEMDAPTLEDAQWQAKRIIAQYPPDTCILKSITPENYKEPPETPAPTPIRPRPGGRPNGGGSPGTPIVKCETLVDQIAEAA